MLSQFLRPGRHAASTTFFDTFQGDFPRSLALTCPCSSESAIVAGRCLFASFPSLWSAQGGTKSENLFLPRFRSMLFHNNVILQCLAALPGMPLLGAPQLMPNAKSFHSNGIHPCLWNDGGTISGLSGARSYERDGLLRYGAHTYCILPTAMR